MRDSLVTRSGEATSPEATRLLELLRYVDGDYHDPATFERLKAALGDAKHPLFYLAIPPSLFAPVVGISGFLRLRRRRPAW